jgi:ribosomal protein L11 methyltransferase
MKARTFQLTIHSDRKDILDHVIGEENIIELSKNESVVYLIYNSSKAVLEGLRKKLIAEGIDRSEIELTSLKDEDWKTKWKKDFKPFWLTKDVYVIPAWLKKKLHPRKKVIYIDSVMAFGTGLHATTQFMAQLIKQCTGQFKSFLDVGTGTGLLTLVALQYGAQDVLAIEYDSDAVKTAKRNFIRNKQNPAWVKLADINKFKSKKAFDFVAANLITHDLIQFKKKIIPLVGENGYLALSGVSTDNFLKIRKEYVRAPFRCVKVMKNKQWTALLLRKGNV